MFLKSYTFCKQYCIAMLVLIYVATIRDDIMHTGTVRGAAASSNCDWSDDTS